jgi:hypothetical protein
VNGFHERLFSLNFGFATAYKSFANDSSSPIAMHTPKDVREFLESLRARSGLLRRYRTTCERRASSSGAGSVRGLFL